VVGAQLEERGLELAVRIAALGNVRLEEAAEPGVTAATRKVVEGGAQLHKVELVDSLRLAHRGLQLLVLEDRGEVGECARERRDRDGVPLGDFVRS
jgi:hypothetical protein